jgi:transposase
MKKTKLQQILNVDLKNQLVNLRNQGKSIREISEITGLSISMLNQITSLFIKKGIWSPNPTWKKRMDTLNAKNNVEVVQPVKRAYTKREPKIVDTITINFKGVNVEVQKSSNIIITESTIVVR